jgi:hypothetical protein
MYSGPRLGRGGRPVQTKVRLHSSLSPTDSRDALVNYVDAIADRRQPQLAVAWL